MPEIRENGIRQKLLLELILDSKSLLNLKNLFKWQKEFLFILV